MDTSKGAGSNRGRMFVYFEPSLRTVRGWVGLDAIGFMLVEGLTAAQTLPVAMAHDAVGIGDALEGMIRRVG
jgi:hypothetical protein